MQGRRRDSQRRSRNRKPPRGFWQPIVPAWEKEFCKVVGSMDWETLLQAKSFMHLYDNVMEWNDSSGKEAFSNAKKRYWAKKNGLPCDISLPDPDLYIDKINWDSDNDPELFSDIESLPMSPETEEDHDYDPVVIFGDSAAPDQVLATLGWGDEVDNLVAPPATCSSDNYADLLAPPAWPGYPNDGWEGYSNDAWQYNNGGGHEYMLWEGDWGNWSWNYANNDCSDDVGSDIRDAWWGDGDQRFQNKNTNVPTTGSGGFVSSYKTLRVGATEQQQWGKHMPRNGEEHDKAPYKRSSTREWNSNSITVGQTWDREWPVSSNPGQERARCL